MHRSEHLGPAVHNHLSLAWNPSRLASNIGTQFHHATSIVQELFASCKGRGRRKGTITLSLKCREFWIFCDWRATTVTAFVVQTDRMSGSRWCWWKWERKLQGSAPGVSQEEQRGGRGLGGWARVWDREPRGEEGRKVFRRALLYITGAYRVRIRSHFAINCLSLHP